MRLLPACAREADVTVDTVDTVGRLANHLHAAEVHVLLTFDVCAM